MAEAKLTEFKNPGLNTHWEEKENSEIRGKKKKVIKKIKSQTKIWVLHSWYFLLLNNNNVYKILLIIVHVLKKNHELSL